MAAFSVAWLLIFPATCFLKVSADDTPVLLGISGSNVTLKSSYKVDSGNFHHGSWYRILPDGRAELTAYFSTYSSQFGRYYGQIAKGSSEVSLAISNVTFKDSGQYFSALHDIEKISLGSITVLTVTDPRRDPNLQLFVSQKPNGTMDVLCEMRDVGSDWDGPRLEMVDGGGTTLMDNKTGKAIDSRGLFVRSAMISFFGGKQAVRVACVSQHNESLIESRRDVTLQSDEKLCWWLLYLSLLCGVLFVVAMAIGVVWLYKAK